jgi:hypothetical protein
VLSISDAVSIIAQAGWITFLFGTMFLTLVLKVIGRFGWKELLYLVPLSQVLAFMLTLPFFLFYFLPGPLLQADYLFMPAAMAEMSVALVVIISLKFLFKKN